MAPPPTPVRKLPPHRARQNQQPAITSTPAVSAPISPAPVIKTGPPASPPVSVNSTAPPHRRVAGPHAKLGPHVHKPSTAPHMQPPSAAQHKPFVDSKEVLVNLESPKSAEKPPALGDPWAELEGPKVKTEPGTAHSSVHAEANSESQIAEATTLIAPAPTTNGTASVPDKRALSHSTDLNRPEKVR
jgi:hypothetical protein